MTTTDRVMHAEGQHDAPQHGDAAAAEDTGAHHLDAPPAAAAPADPELPEPGKQGDLENAGQIADYALAKLRRYVVGSDEISSHFIELSVRLGELYARLGEAQLGQPGPPPAVKAETAPPADEPQLLFALEDAEAAIESAPVSEQT